MSPHLHRLLLSFLLVLIAAIDHTQLMATPSPVCPDQFDCSNQTSFSQVSKCWNDCTITALTSPPHPCQNMKCNNFMSEMCSRSPDCGPDLYELDFSDDNYSYCLATCNFVFLDYLGILCENTTAIAPCGLLPACLNTSFCDATNSMVDPHDLIPALTTPSCPNNVNYNCSNRTDLFTAQSGCYDFREIDCLGANMTECIEICTYPNCLNSDCGRGLSTLFEFCVRLSVSCPNTRPCSNLLEIECVMPVDSRCDSICGDGLTGISDEFDYHCLSEVNQFCSAYLRALLNSTNSLSDQQFLAYVSIVDNSVGDAFPTVIIDQLDDLIEQLDKSDILSDGANKDLLSEVFDDLFSDAIEDDWIADMDTKVEDRTLLALEQLSSLLGNDLIKSENSTAFQFIGDNFAFKQRAVNTEMIVDDAITVSVSPKGMDDEGGSVNFPTEVLCGDYTANCSSVVSMTVIRNLASYLHSNVQTKSNSTSAGGGMRNGSSDMGNGSTNPPLTDVTDLDYSMLVPNSHLVALQAFGVSYRKEKLANKPVDIFFNLLQKNSSEKEVENTFCVYWNHKTKTWASDGVTTFKISDDRVKCTSTHLTSFAVLVSFNSDLFRNSTSMTEKLALNVVSYIGCGISIVCLVVTITCLIVFRKILNKGTLMYIHLNLCIALLLGYVTFVAGIETATPIPILCTIVAALIQYFFLCVFCWMLAEGIMLYLLVVRVFGKAAERWYWFLLFAWGLPIPIVGLSAGLLSDQYGNEDYCWITTDVTKAALWTFVVPVIIVILVNTVILVLTIYNIVRGKKYGGAESNVSNVKLAKAAIRGTIILLPLLGITWIIGIFSVSAATTVFSWLFVLLNSLQGLFIFILHILRNRTLWRKLKQLCKKESSLKTLSDYHMSADARHLNATMFSTVESSQPESHRLTPLPQRRTLSPEDSFRSQLSVHQNNQKEVEEVAPVFTDKDSESQHCNVTIIISNSDNDDSV